MRKRLFKDVFLKIDPPSLPNVAPFLVWTSLNFSCFPASFSFFKSYCVWEIILKNTITFSIIFNYMYMYLPVKEGVTLHLKTWIPFTKFGWNWPSDSREVKKVKMCYDKHTNGQTDVRQKMIRNPHLSFQLKWAEKYTLFLWSSLLGPRYQTFYVFACSRF